jgi:ABC-2 type transport system ATP-binding protein
MSVKLESVTKLYGNQKALDHVSVNVKSGEIVGLLGPNGAGKSTIMKIITGYMQPDDGFVEVNGLSVKDHSLAIRKQIGYLPENNPLYTDLYVAEYLEYVAGLYHLKGIKAKVNEMIHLTGLEREQHKKINALSKGYRQRIGIAQALIHDPAVLILDEPTSGLDPTQIVEIRQLIRTISVNKTVILSTHIMQEVEALCDRIIIINQGQIVAADSPANIKAFGNGETQLYVVEFLEPIKEKILLKIPGVLESHLASGNTFILKGGKDDLRPLIFKFAVVQKLTILTLSKQESSLEKEFMRITNSTNN